MNERPWLKRYDPLLPHTLEPYPDCTLLDKLAETVQQRPDHVTIIFKGLHISAARLEALSNDFAAALLDLGVTKGERVAALLPNSPQAIIAQLGAWKAGAIFCPINSTYTEWELEHALNECEADVGGGAQPVLREGKVSPTAYRGQACYRCPYQGFPAAFAWLIVYPG